MHNRMFKSGILLLMLFALIAVAAAQEDTGSTWLIFGATLDDQDGIFRMRPDGSDLQNLIPDTKPLAGIDAISPDNRWIYFSQDTNLYRVRTDGSEIQQITTDENQMLGNGFGTLSPDGEYIFFTRDMYNLVYRMHSDGSDIQRIPEMHYFPLEYDFTWSPDGQWMYFELEADDAPDGLYRMNLAGDVEFVTRNLAEKSLKFEDFSFYPNSSFLPGGEWLLFECSTEQHNSSICRMHYDGSDAQELTPFTASDITLSPDETWLYIHGGDGDTHPIGIYRMQLDGSELQQVTHFEAYTSWGGFTPDGTKMQVWVGKYQGKIDLYRMNLDGSDPEIILSGDGITGDGWSPDGRWMFFTDDDFNQADIYRAAPDGTGFENITHNPGLYREFGWWGDDEWLIYLFGHLHASPTLSEGAMYRMNTNTLEVEQLTGRGLFPFGQIYRVKIE